MTFAPLNQENISLKFLKTFQTKLGGVLNSLRSVESLQNQTVHQTINVATKKVCISSKKRKLIELTLSTLRDPDIILKISLL